MNLNPKKQNRKINRLQEYDYHQAGFYFVTICTHKRICCLGEVTDGAVALFEWGEIAANGWGWLENQYRYVKIDLFCVMPNHCHAVVEIRESSSPGRGGSRTAPTARKSLGSLVGSYKTFTTKQINHLRGTPGTRFWQRSFYDHIIRGKDDLDNVRRYIRDNALKWEPDQENPINR